jgi:dihydroorotase
MHKEDFLSGSAAAAVGGVTTLLDMPTDDPWTSTADELRAKLQLASSRIHTDVGFQVVLRRGLAGIHQLRELDPVSFELFTADVPPEFMFDSLDAVTEALRQLAPLNILVGVSPGDQSILEGSGARNPDGRDVAAFLASRPPVAEANGIARALLAAAETNARVHIRQINSALGIDLWRRLRDMADASVETTPQCLLFSNEDYATQGPNLKGSPPMRPPADVEALRAAMRDGLIDIIATDHAPHSPTEKAASYRAFADIPGGMPGVQTLLATMLHFVDRGDIGLSDIVRMCATNPAIRFGLDEHKGAISAGRDADILVLDPRRSTVVRNADQLSRAAYTPFDGLEVAFQVRSVLLRGTEIARDGMLVSARTGRIAHTRSL